MEEEATKAPAVHALLLLQHKAAGEDTAHLSFLACSHQPKTEIFNLWIRRKPKHWAAGKGSDGKWLIWHRRGEHHSSPLHSGFLMSTDHISIKLTSRWEKYIPPKHKGFMPPSSSSLSSCNSCVSSPCPPSLLSSLHCLPARKVIAKLVS